MLRYASGFVLAAIIMTGSGAAYSQSGEAPGWIKSVAEYWKDGKIMDSEFVAAMDFLINRGIIHADEKERYLAAGGTDTGMQKQDNVQESVRITPTIEFDQMDYTWTDKVYVHIVSPDHNLDDELVEEIGGKKSPVRITTSMGELDHYRLVETGPDTGIFAGELILTGFLHNADGKIKTGNDLGQDVGETIPANYKSIGRGPAGGLLPTAEEDVIAAYFEFAKDETVVSSVIVRWNLGEVSWLESAYDTRGVGKVRVIDPDMNWNPEAVDVFDIEGYSDIEIGGLDITVTETGLATGIFDGRVFFTEYYSTGTRLGVAEGDTVTAIYTDHTLPDMPGKINTPSDKKEIIATAVIEAIPLDTQNFVRINEMAQHMYRLPK